MKAKHKQDAVAIGLVQHGQGRCYLGLRAHGHYFWIAADLYNFNVSYGLAVRERKR